jgi:hypothetical protein
LASLVFHIGLHPCILAYFTQEFKLAQGELGWSDDLDLV